jgi:site-specific recombinase XerD
MFEINHFLDTNPRARYFKHSDIVIWLEDLKTRYEKKETRIRILAAIKRYYDYLVFSGKRSDHPCKTIKIKRKKKAIQTQDLFTMAELQMLFNRENRYKLLESRNKVVISLMVCQGLTSDEIVNLNVQNVDLDTFAITIKASRTLSGRTLELDKSQIRLFDEYINTVRPQLVKTQTTRLIVNKRGQKEFTVDSLFSIIETMKPLFPDRNLNPERIRMSVISHWLNDKRLPVEQVMDLSGIKWASSVMMYKKINEVEQREIVNRFHPLR